MYLLTDFIVGYQKYLHCASAIVRISTYAIWRESQVRCQLSITRMRSLYQRANWIPSA